MLEVSATEQLATVSTVSMYMSLYLPSSSLSFESENLVKRKRNINTTKTGSQVASLAGLAFNIHTYWSSHLGRDFVRSDLRWTGGGRCVGGGCGVGDLAVGVGEERRGDAGGVVGGGISLGGSVPLTASSQGGAAVDGGAMLLLGHRYGMSSARRRGFGRRVIAGENFRRNWRLRRVTRPEPSTRMTYWLCWRTSTTSPVLSHRLGFGPSWFWRRTQSPTARGGSRRVCSLQRSASFIWRLRNASSLAASVSRHVGCG